MKQILIAIGISLGVGILLGYFIFTPKIETVTASMVTDTAYKPVIQGRIDTLWRTRVKLVYVPGSAPIRKAFTYEQAQSIAEDTIYFRDSIPVPITIKVDTSKHITNVVMSQVQLDTKFYGGRLLDTKVWLDPVYFPQKQAVIREWRGFPMVSFMMSARLVHDYAIGVGLNIDRFGIIIHSPLEKEGVWDTELVVHF